MTHSKTFITVYVLFLIARVVFLLSFLLPFYPWDSAIVLAFLFEFCLLFAASWLIPYRPVRTVLIAPFALIEAFQLSNIYVTGKLIDPLTLVNLAEADSVGAVAFLTAGICIAWLILWSPDFIRKPFITIKSKWLSLLIGFALLAAAPFIPNTASGEFRDKAITAWKIETYEPHPTDGKRFYRATITDRTTAPVINGVPTEFKDWNVVLIFAEGTSRIVISPEVTPNTYKLMTSGIDFQNYYSHTAATFRGIRGQLISGYQQKGGAPKKGDGIGQISGNSIEEIYKGRTESLPEMLDKKGYQTEFLSPHTNDFGLNVLMKAIGFEKVIGLDPNKNSDKDLYAALWNQTQKLASENKPFFLATYVLGTHVGMDSPDLKYGDGSNPELNKYYNQDHWLGEFVKKLENSPIADKTLVIFTTDHASYPTNDFKDTFKSANNTFIGEVPFIIWHKGMKGAVIDADSRNSLLLAPTLADLLGIRQEPNHFLANSAFDKPRGFQERMSVFDFETYKTSEKGVGPRRFLYELDPEERDFVEEFFSYGR